MAYTYGPEGNADTLDGYHAGSFGLRCADNDFISHGNEFNFVKNDWPENTYICINYRSSNSDITTRAIPKYALYNGQKGYLGTIVTDLQNFTCTCLSEHDYPGSGEGRTASYSSYPLLLIRTWLRDYGTANTFCIPWSYAVTQSTITVRGLNPDYRCTFGFTSSTSYVVQSNNGMSERLIIYGLKFTV